MLLCFTAVPLEHFSNMLNVPMLYCKRRVQLKLFGVYPASAFRTNKTSVHQSVFKSFMPWLRRSRSESCRSERFHCIQPCWTWLFYRESKRREFVRKEILKRIRYNLLINAHNVPGLPLNKLADQTLNEEKKTNLLYKFGIIRHLIGKSNMSVWSPKTIRMSFSVVYDDKSGIFVS